MFEIVSQLRNLMEKTGTSYAEAAVASRTSPSTIRWVLATGELPRRRPTRERLERFVKRNSEAQSRTDIRFAE